MQHPDETALFTKNPALPLDASTARYLQLLDALQQAAIATTAAGEITGWSRSAEQLYGWTRDDALGRNIVDVTPAMMSRDDAANIMSTLAGGAIWSGQFPVQTRTGETFVASVTDVPIVDGEGDVVGVVGVSARSRGPAFLASILVRFGSAAEALWPGRVFVPVTDLEAAVPASEPHVLQLLALLLIRYADALDGGSLVDVSVGPAAESVFADFGIRSQRPYAYLRFAERSERPSYSLLRDEISAARPTNYAAALVRLVGGWLFVESAGNGRQTAHLLLPIDVQGFATTT